LFAILIVGLGIGASAIVQRTQHSFITALTVQGR
jgi:hypothetical protein